MRHRLGWLACFHARNGIIGCEFRNFTWIEQSSWSMPNLVRQRGDTLCGSDITPCGHDGIPGDLIAMLKAKLESASGKRAVSNFL